MATASGTEQGKTSFVEEFLKDHGDAAMAEVNGAWKSFGREGTISESLFRKARRNLGLTKGRAGMAAKVSEGTARARTPAAAGKVGKKATTSRRVGAGAGESLARRTRPSSVAASTSKTEDRNQMLIALEKDLDRLLFGVLEGEGMGEFEEHIRAARRVIAREIR